jgi:hypothetical protein
MLRCWHLDEQFFFGEVYAAQKTAIVQHLAPIQQALWRRRWLTHAGVLRAAMVILPARPANVQTSVRRAYDAIKELFEIRWQFEPGKPVPISWRFLASWGSMGERQAGEAMHELLRLGILHAADKLQIGGCRMTVFMPGSGKVRAVRKHGSPTPPPVGSNKSQHYCHFKTKEARHEGVGGFRRGNVEAGTVSVPFGGSLSAGRPAPVASSPVDLYGARFRAALDRVRAHPSPRRTSDGFRMPSARDMKRELGRAIGIVLARRPELAQQLHDAAVGGRR